VKLSDYLLLPLEDRKSHIDLSSPCELVPIPRFTRQKRLDFFGVENDVDDHRKAGINRCHVCDHGQSKGRNRVCHNPLHWYVGTMSENSFDIPFDLRGAGGRSLKGIPKPHSNSHKLALRVPRPRKRMRCLVTGVEMDSSWLSRYQNKHGIPTTQREEVQ